jgi:hypothetical protein
VYPLWREVQTTFESVLADAENNSLDERTLSRWIAVVQIMLKTDRRILVQNGFPDRYDELIESLCNAVTEDADASVTYPDDDAISSDSDRFFSISTDLDELLPYFPHLENSLRTASSDAYHRYTSLRDRVRDNDSEPSWSTKRSATAYPDIDLERLFSDL